jgi:trigger factor
VQDGDYLTIDLSASVDGELVPGSESKGLTYEVGSDNLIPGLDDAVRGKKEGDESTFQTELKQGDYAGRTADVTVTIVGVKEKVLPELDDEFATTASEFDTLDELKADLTDRLEKMRRYEQGAQARDKLLDKLLELVDVPLPESAVKAEVDGREHNLGHELERYGMSREVYLETIEKTDEEFRAETREASEKAVKSQLVLDALADKEELTVEQEELTDHLIRRAQQSGMAPQDFANQIMQGGNIGVLFSEVRRGKALAGLMESAKIVDESGNEVDLSLLDESDAAEAADAESDEAFERRMMGLEDEDDSDLDDDDLDEDDDEDEDEVVEAEAEVEASDSKE